MIQTNTNLKEGDNMKCYAQDFDCKECQHFVLCEIAQYVEQLENKYLTEIKW